MAGKSERHLILHDLRIWCRWRDLNPHDFLWSQDFKSCASAISPHRQLFSLTRATWAGQRRPRLAPEWSKLAAAPPIALTPAPTLYFHYVHGRVGSFGQTDFLSRERNHRCNPVGGDSPPSLSAATATAPCPHTHWPLTPVTMLAGQRHKSCRWSKFLASARPSCSSARSRWSRHSHADQDQFLVEAE